MFSIKPIICLFAILSVVTLAGCASEQPAQAVPDKNGIVHVPARRHYGGYIAGYDEVKFAGGTLHSDGNPQNLKSRIEVKYDDGSVLTIWVVSQFESGVNLESLTAFKNGCSNPSNCPEMEYEDHHYGIGALDGRDWMDSNIWVLFDLNADRDIEKFQACRDGQYYSAPNPKTLMDVVDKIDRDPAAAKADPGVKKYELADDALEHHLPVCNWRHRIGLETAYPPPPNLEQTRIVPASHAHLKYVEIRGDKGSAVDVYVDEGKKRLDKFVFVSPKGSSTLRPVYEGNDCPTFDRCEHFVLGPEKKPDRLDIHSLDSEPLIQSRLFKVDDTVAGLKVYDGCAGGRLYTGKNRQEIENDVKEAIANPAPPPAKGAPMMGAPETSESGDVVVPDTFCDWAFRREQAEAIKKSQASR